ILYHKCEFQIGMISVQAIREMMGFHHQSLLEVLQRCMDKKQISGSLDLEVIKNILHGSLSGIVKNRLMNHTSYDL
ncbi:transcriptional regulator, partial [Salmonella enterica subsp. enterica serovar Typhimurium]